MTTVTTSVPKLLTIRQAAEVTGLSRWRFYELIAQGKGPAYMRVGRTIRISESALIDWIERQHENPQTLRLTRA